jgi:nitroreductase
MNRQPWQIIVITNKSLIEDLDAEGMRILAEAEDKTTYDRFMSRGGTLFYNAPCMYLVLQQPGTDRDTGIVSENIALAATSLGLGNVICGMAAIPLNGPKADEYKKKLGIGDGWEFGIAVLVGYGMTENAPHTPDISKIRFVE